MSPEGLRDRLHRGDVLVADGAWGTLLMEHGLPPGRPPESFNLDRPEVLAEIARQYLAAGADLVTTNTFGGSPLRLRPYGLEERTEEINRVAVEAVRRAVGGRAAVLASIGPCGRLLRPYGDAAPGEIAAGFTRQARALAEAGADAFCVETMTDLAEACLAVRAARAAAPHLPIVATMTFDRAAKGFFTVMGVSIARAASELAEAGAELIGSNCGNGIGVMCEIAREFHACTALPIAIQANAGLPQSGPGAPIYPETPEAFAARVPELMAVAVRMIGGCCGTTPAHVRAIRAAVDQARVA